jgi:hypothetical protein
MNQNIVYQPYDSSNNFINQVIFYNTELFEKTVYSLQQGIAGRDGENANYNIVELMVEDILLKNPTLKGANASIEDIELAITAYFQTNPLDYNRILSGVETFFR